MRTINKTLAALALGTAVASGAVSMSNGPATCVSADQLAAFAQSWVAAWQCTNQ